MTKNIKIEEIMDKNRITSAEFLELTKISQATLSRKVKDENFISSTGAKKEMTETSKIPSWTFDKKLAEKYASDPQDKPQKVNIATGKNSPPKKTPLLLTDGSERKQVSTENILLIPYKIYLTLDEAKLLTGFPKSELHKFSELKFGRRVIKKSELEKL